jgi:hypothetical protein
MRQLFFFGVLILAFPAWAQDDAQIAESAGLPSVTEDKDSVRRYYIKSFPEYFFLYPVLKQRSLNFELAKRDGSSILTYKPNNTYNLGLGVYLFELGLEISFAIPLQERSIERFGESEARDLHLNVFTKRWGLDALYQRYSGFYVVDKENEPEATEPYPQRPDIATKNFGLSWHYLFNHQKFSFRSAYNFSERQLYSKGSFLLFTSLHTFRVAADSSIVHHDRRASFGSAVNFTRLRYTTFSVSPGYTFNLIYNNFFLNTTLGLGPAHNWINYDLEGHASTRHDTAINAFVNARLAIGYNGYRIFGGIGFMSQGGSVRFEDSTFSNNNGVFKILVGYRFKESGILKKRAWDMIPFDI